MLPGRRKQRHRDLVQYGGGSMDANGRSLKTIDACFNLLILIKGAFPLSTIAANDEFVTLVWSQNENNSPTILVTNGVIYSTIYRDDGIDYCDCRAIIHPEQSTAFFFRRRRASILSNHISTMKMIIYHWFTILIRKKFFHLSDQKLNYHPARQVGIF